MRAPSGRAGSWPKPDILTSGDSFPSTRSYAIGRTSGCTSAANVPSGSFCSMAGGPKDSSAPSRLTPLQVDLLEAFFAREQRFVLTGGAALAGFYFGHRETEDLDFFGTPGLDLQEAARTLEVACTACGAALESVQTFPDFRRYLARRAQETCIVDLVIDRVPMLDSEKCMVGRLRIDTTREIAAN